MTRKKSKKGRKRIYYSIDKMKVLFFVIAVIIGSFIGGWLSYDTTHQEFLTKKEFDEMYHIALSAKESELIIDNNYIITISNDEISVKTHDNNKGILKMDLTSKDCNYEIEYRYNIVDVFVFIFLYCFSCFVLIFFVECSIYGLISYVSDKIKRVIKK